MSVKCTVVKMRSQMDISTSSCVCQHPFYVLQRTVAYMSAYKCIHIFSWNHWRRKTRTNLYQTCLCNVKTKANLLPSVVRIGVLLVSTVVSGKAMKYIWQGTAWSHSLRCIHY